MARGSAAVARTGKRPQKTETRVSTSARLRVKGGAAEDGAAYRRDANDGPMAALSAAREPTPAERMRAVRLSRINHKRSGVYGQIVDTLVNFVYGDGVTVTCKSDAETAFVRKVFEDPENDWDGTLRKKLVALLIDGEYILSATSPIRGNVNGVPTPASAVLFGRMEPESVVGVKTRKLNADVVTHLVFRGEDSKDFTLPVLGRGTEPLATEDGLAGVFFWRVNTLGRRGMPYLSRSLDKATMLDACVEHLAGKAEHANRFWMHATYEPEPGTDRAAKTKNEKTEAELRAWLESPEVGAVAATTKGIEVKAIAPVLGVVEARDLVELLLEYILGSHGIPRMWYSAGGDTNRATAVEQGTPIHRAIDALQAVLRGMIEDVVRYVLRIGRASGAIPAPAAPAPVPGAQAPTDDGVVVTMADVATRDSLRDVDELAKLVAVLDSFVASQILSAVEAQAIGRKAMQGKSWGDLVKKETAPPVPVPAPTIAPPPPGYRPGQPAPQAPPRGDPGAGAPPPGSGDLPAARSPG